MNNKLRSERNRLLRWVICLCLCMLIVSVIRAQTVPSTSRIHSVAKNLTRTIVHDIFSPPVASRVYLYAHIAAYETIILGDSHYRSLYGQVKDFPKIDALFDSTKVDLHLASIIAFAKTGGALVYSEKILQDSIAAVLDGFKDLDPKVYNNSMELGEQVASHILSYAKEDRYAVTRKQRRYSYEKNPGKWMPTPPGYMDAIEPYWNKIRPVSLDSASQFKPMPPPEFSLDSSSRFMQEVFEVYRVTNNLDQEKISIASFWDCNPFFLNTQGHLNFATKKLSPGGHWMSITGQVAETQNLDWKATYALYLMTSIALFDGFISCWDEKYRSQLIRPETFINAHIDEGWRPKLQTPPFPEYTSGHSVISTAAAFVLSESLGDQFSFTDYTEVEYGLPARTFTSFREASNEAAISRLYGGIHYRSAIEQGQLQGEMVGRHVLTRIILTR